MEFLKHNCKPTTPLGQTGHQLANPNKAKPVSNPTIARILQAAEMALANDCDVVPTVARATNLSHAVIEQTLAKAWQSERASRLLLTSAVKGGIDAAHRTFWDRMQEAA